jgi:hypothetical protein
MGKSRGDQKNRVTGCDGVFLSENTKKDERSWIGRGERIRTSGLYVPNVALHQAELHPAPTRAVAAASQ